MGQKHWRPTTQKASLTFLTSKRAFPLSLLAFFPFGSSISISSAIVFYSIIKNRGCRVTCRLCRYDSEMSGALFVRTNKTPLPSSIAKKYGYSKLDIFPFFRPSIPGYAFWSATLICILASLLNNL